MPSTLEIFFMVDHVDEGQWDGHGWGSHPAVPQVHGEILLLNLLFLDSLVSVDGSFPVWRTALSLPVPRRGLFSCVLFFVSISHSRLVRTPDTSVNAMQNDVDHLKSPSNSWNALASIMAPPPWAVNESPVVVS